MSTPVGADWNDDVVVQALFDDVGLGQADFKFIGVIRFARMNSNPELIPHLEGRFEPLLEIAAEYQTCGSHLAPTVRQFCLARRVSHQDLAFGQWCVGAKQVEVVHHRDGVRSSWRT